MPIEEFLAIQMEQSRMQANLVVELSKAILIQFCFMNYHDSHKMCLIIKYMIDSRVRPNVMNVPKVYK